MRLEKLLPLKWVTGLSIPLVVALTSLYKGMELLLPHIALNTVIKSMN